MKKSTGWREADLLKNNIFLAAVWSQYKITLTNNQQAIAKEAPCDSSFETHRFIEDQESDEFVSVSSLSTDLNDDELRVPTHFQKLFSRLFQY